MNHVRASASARLDALRRRVLSFEAHAFGLWNRRVDRRISLIVGSALIIYGIGTTTRPVHTRVEFYAVVAQLMPVLMLVAAVNGRYFRERQNAQAFDTFLIRGFWIAGLAGIGAALAVIARGHDSILLRGTVIYALALTGVLVTVYAIYGPAHGVHAAPQDSANSSGNTEDGV